MFDVDPRLQLTLTLIALGVVLVALFAARPDPRALAETPAAQDEGLDTASHARAEARP